MCPAAIAEVEKINSWETLSLAKGQLGRVYAVQGKRQEALEIADKLRRRSMQQYKDPFMSPETLQATIMSLERSSVEFLRWFAG
ncbi:MAG: hypothetical protein ACLP3K_18195 [Candidatus Acidiferrales bacterium]